MTSIAFAAVAVAVLAYLSRPRVSSMPPLTPSAALPSIGPSASPSGVSPLLLGAILLPWGLLAWSHLISRSPSPSPPPEPQPAVSLDLRGEWQGQHAAEDAAMIGQLMDDLAWFIEDDGKSSSPRLVSGQQLSELRSRSRHIRTRGESIASRQARAIDAIASFLEKEVGNKGGPLEGDDRERWVNAFRAVSLASWQSIGR